MVPQRILIADDHDLIREGLRTILACTEDATVVGEARSGLEAIDLTAELEPDVVLMDVTMPEMDGIEATRAIKGRWPDVRVIIISIAEDKGSILEAVRAGASGYISKSASLDEIRRAINTSPDAGVYLSPTIASRVIGSLWSDNGDGHEEPEPLTAREHDVLELLIRGLTARSIGHRLGISERTVDTHISSLYRRLGVNNRVDAVTKAMRKGLVALPG